MRFENRRFILGCGAVVALVAAAAFFLYGLSPASAERNTSPVVFEVKQGQGFRTIIANLRDAGIVRSYFATEAFSLMNGSAFKMRPGLYKLDPSTFAPSILGELSGGAEGEVAVTIPEGSSLYQIDAILSNALIIHRDELINFHGVGDLEGKLFPDTYRLFTGARVGDVVQKFIDNFNAKAAALLAQDQKNATSDIIIASLVEKEVADPSDQKIVAGIIWKRLKVGMPLDLDATICYAKSQIDPMIQNCLPITSFDKKIDSQYNTYLYKGLPPGPIGNPGISAITAAIQPKSSPYWYYLSDPKTGKTIFATTLDEQNENRVKYLKGN